MQATNLKWNARQNNGHSMPTFCKLSARGVDKQPAEGCNVGNSLLIATMEEETLKGDQQLLLITN